MLRMNHVLCFLLSVFSFGSSAGDPQLHLKHSDQHFWKEDAHGVKYALAWMVQIDESCWESSSNESSLQHTNIFKALRLQLVGRVMENVYLVIHKHHFQYSYGNCIRTKGRSTNINADGISECDHALLWNQIKKSVENELNQNKCISSFAQETAQKRFHRSLLELYEDPLYNEQWYLDFLDVPSLWSEGITGKGITVAVVDDGVQAFHKDLIQNFDFKDSWDFVSNAFHNPTPPLGSDEFHPHGTRCAGIIGASANGICGVGVAPDVRLAGIRLLNDHVTDSTEAAALIHSLNNIDIYSCSWGPSDNGNTISGPGFLTQRALKTGSTIGRKGLGAIYVVAAGNGGLTNDDCNWDGYANSIYTITIGSVDEFGFPPPYSEPCSTVLASTYSSGRTSERKLVTTELSSHNTCTRNHSGTSAAAALASGIIALVLQVRPCLTWRDIQHILIVSSSSESSEKVDLPYNRYYGFGILNARKLVKLSSVWELVPPFATYEFPIRENNFCSSNVFTVFSSKEEMEEVGLLSLEFVQVRLWLKLESRGLLYLRIRCPRKQRYVTLTSPRPNDKTSSELSGWSMSTVECWGQRSWGYWHLNIEEPKNITKNCELKWQLTIYGSSMTKEKWNFRRKHAKHLLSSDTSPIKQNGCLIEEKDESFFRHKAIMIGGIVTLICIGVVIFKQARNRKSRSTPSETNPSAKLLIKEKETS